MKLHPGCEDHGTTFTSPSGWVKLLFTDPDRIDIFQDVKAAAICADVDILLPLIHHPAVDVRYALAQNPALPFDVVVQMATEDVDERVRQIALDRIDLITILGGV